MIGVIGVKLSNDENTDLLLGLGLNLTQARVYLSILRLDRAKVGQISKFSKVRREEVYRILPALERMGLVERILGKPTIIRATPISDALNFLVTEEKTKSDERVSSMRIRVQKLASKDWAQGDLKESIYILIPDRLSILTKTSSLIKNSKKEVCFIADKGRVIPFLSQFLDEIRPAVKKGIQMRMIFEGSVYENLLKEKVRKMLSGDSIHIKFHFEALNHFVVSDDKEALVTTSKESGLGESAVLWTNNDNLIGVLKTSFESSWKTAED
jgi:sugar-specific transcriptional regulator TrmB